MSGPRRARRIAIEVLYQADLTGADPGDVLAEWVAAGRDVPDEARALVQGVSVEMPAIDLLLEELSEGWSVARMSVVDRTILRVGAYELLHRDDVPTSVAVSEAVEAAVQLSSDEARRFVNGVLGAIARGRAGG